SAEMQAQEALADREELLRRLTNAMPVGLLQLDTDRTVIYNNARLLEILAGRPEPTGAGDARAAAAPGDPVADGGSAGAASAGAVDHEAVTFAVVSGATADEPPAPPAPLDEILATVTEESRGTFDAALAEVLAEGVDRDVELDVTLPGGEWRRLLMSV